MAKKKPDTFTFLTRVQPVLIVIAPLLIIGILFSFEFEKYIHILTSVGLYTVMSFLVAEIGRDSGVRKQDALWRSWGGPYSTILLRWDDSNLSKETKLNYYKRLEKQYPLSQPFNLKNSNDDVFAFWTGKLREKTRNKKAYSLIYAENVSYGFRRNLWGMKPFAISLNILAAIILPLYYAHQQHTFDWTKYPISFWIVELILGVLLAFWFTIVNPKWVSIPAKAYAERLFEAI